MELRQSQGYGLDNRGIRFDSLIGKRDLCTLQLHAPEALLSLPTEQEAWLVPKPVRTFRRIEIYLAADVNRTMIDRPARRSVTVPITLSRLHVKKTRHAFTLRIRQGPPKPSRMRRCVL